MNQLKIMLFAAICLIASSCSILEKIDVFPQEDDTSSYRITSKKYYFSDKSYGLINFIYNNQGKLAKKEWFNPGNEMDFLENFTYEQNKLIRIDRNVNKAEFAEVMFTYENGKIKTIEYWLEDKQGILQKYHTTGYEYQNGQISKTTSTQYDGTPSYYSIYTYVNGNITSIKSYELTTSVFVSEATFEYDNKPNPFYRVTDQYLGSPIASSKNNVIHDKFVSLNNNSQNSEIHYEYTYNGKGYPIEMYLIGQDNKKHLDESYTYSE